MADIYDPRLRDRWLAADPRRSDNLIDARQYPGGGYYDYPAYALQDLVARFHPYLGILGLLRAQQEPISLDPSTGPGQGYETQQRALQGILNVLVPR